VLGPNSGGVIRPGRRLAASFLTCLDRPAGQIRSGPVGLVTQSGGTGSYLHNIAAARGGGLAVSVSTGNEVDVDVADGITALCDLDEVRAIALVLETVRDGDAFVAAVERAHAAGTPVVACRIGGSRHGQSLLRSHTGAIASAPRVLDGVLDTLGVTRVETPAELLDVAEVMARTAAPAGARAGVVTHSGGVAILLSDLAERAGVALPPPSAALRRNLAPLLDLGSADNPLDMGAIIGGPHRFARVVDTFAGSGDYDAVLAVSTAHPPAHTPARVDALIDLEPAVPVVHLWMAGDQGAEGLRRLRDAGCAVTEEPRAAVRALVGLGVRSRAAGAVRRPAARRAALSPSEAGTAWSEHAAKELLASWGLPVVEGDLATTPGQAAEIAGRLGGPVAVKVASPDIPHKTEVGGIRLGVVAADASAAFTEATAAARRARPDARIDGARVERQRTGVEVIVGAFHDRVFGPMILLGLGGTAAEALEGHAVGLAPVDPDAATLLIDRAAGVRHVLARHGDPAAAVQGLARLLATTSERFVAAGIHEIEMNPLTWTGGTWQVVDALVTAPAGWGGHPPKQA
jgi:acyl-CoA synthetase (NDP forming)